mmetsp:Transcript_15597/g.51074  ORF Transcript_15597/g.51074 Transcript_15597/m.51074 type:complete len:485 (-) Transcript_15597:190-1644(-)
MLAEVHVLRRLLLHRWELRRIPGGVRQQGEGRDKQQACWHARDEVVRELDARERGLEVATDVEEGGEGQASARRVARHHHVFGAVELDELHVGADPTVERLGKEEAALLAAEARLGGERVLADEDGLAGLLRQEQPEKVEEVGRLAGEPGGAVRPEDHLGTRRSRRDVGVRRELVAVLVLEARVWRRRQLAADGLAVAVREGLWERPVASAVPGVVHLLVRLPDRHVRRHVRGIGREAGAAAEEAAAALLVRDAAAKQAWDRGCNVCERLRSRSEAVRIVLFGAAAREASAVRGLPLSDIVVLVSKGEREELATAAKELHGAARRLRVLRRPPVWWKVRPGIWDRLWPEELGAAPCRRILRASGRTPLEPVCEALLACHRAHIAADASHVADTLIAVLPEASAGEAGRAASERAELRMPHEPPPDVAAGLNAAAHIEGERAGEVARWAAHGARVAKGVAEVAWVRDEIVPPAGVLAVGEEFLVV